MSQKLYGTSWFNRSSVNMYVQTNCSGMRYTIPRVAKMRKAVNGYHSCLCIVGAHSSCSIVGKLFLWAHLPQSAAPVTVLNNTQWHRPNNYMLSLLSKR